MILVVVVLLAWGFFKCLVRYLMEFIEYEF